MEAAGVEDEQRLGGEVDCSGAVADTQLEGEVAGGEEEGKVDEQLEAEAGGAAVEEDSPYNSFTAAQLRDEVCRLMRVWFAAACAFSCALHARHSLCFVCLCVARRLPT